MKIGEQYIQYSKIFTSVAGIAYIVQVITTIILVCTMSDASEHLIEILGTTTGIVGIIFGCYSGNSAVEKVVTKTTASSKGNCG